MNSFFTKQEKIFIGFLLVSFIIGSAIKLYRYYFPSESLVRQNGSLEDFEKQLQRKAAEIDSLLAEQHAVSQQPVGSALPAKQNRVAQSAVPGMLWVEINTATVAELVQLPQIGPVIAAKIIEYRTAHGPFRDIDELIEVKGIGEKKLTTIKPYIYIKQK